MRDSVDKNNRVKLTDFGLARVVDSEDITRTGFMMGTPDYCSPEQIQDAKSVDCRADIYSLGATFYETVTGESPKYFREENIPGGIQPLIKKAMASDPKRRYQTVWEFIEAFEGEVEEETTAIKIACPQCGLRNPTDVKYCVKCGNSLSHLFDKCPKCQRENRIDVEYCGGCGFNVYNYRKIQRLTEKTLKLREQQKYTEAIGNWEKILEIEPENDNATNELTRDKETAGTIEKLCDKLEENRTKHDWLDIVSSIIELEKLSQERAKDYRDLKDETETYFRNVLETCIEKDDYQEAVKVIETLIDLMGETDELKNMFSSYKSRANEISEVTTWAKKILSSQKNPKEALDRLKGIETKYPKNTEMISLSEQIRKAIIAHREIKLKKANQETQEFKGSKKSISEAIEAWEQYLNVAESTGERSLAEKTLEQLRQEKDRLANLLQQLEDALELKRYEHFSELIKLIREIQKGNARCLEAERIKEKIDQCEAHKTKAHEALKELDYEAALHEFQAAVLIDPHDHVLQETVKKITEMLKGLEIEVEKIYTRLQKKEELGDEPQYISELFSMYPKSHRLLELKDKIEQQEITDLIMSAHGYLLENKFREAAAKFEEALKINPNNTWIKLSLLKINRLTQVKEGQIIIGVLGVGGFLAAAYFCNSPTPILIFYSCKNNSLLLQVDRGAPKVLGTTLGSLTNS